MRRKVIMGAEKCKVVFVQWGDLRNMWIERSLMGNEVEYERKYK